VLSCESPVEGDVISFLRLSLTSGFMDEIWAIILAAGESKRMGSPKMLLPFNGRTMVEEVIFKVSDSKAGRTLVVLGAYSDPIGERIGSLNVMNCFNENYREGMLSSVQCGFRNLPQYFKAAMVFQGDQPLITPYVINSLIDAYLLSGKGLAVPVYKSKRGHPLLIDFKYRNEIEKLSPDTGLHSLIDKFPDDLLEVNTDEPGILRDFDTYEEYMKGINQIH
jgi:molybdenum cofactor cytidylyltransferase